MASEKDKPATAPVRGIFAKMLKLMEEVGGIGKNRQVQAGYGGPSYQYRGIDDLYAALHPALRKVGIAMFPVMDASTLKSERVEGTRKSGATYAQTTVTFSLNVLFVDQDDGSMMTVTVPAQGVDDSDKAAGKAMSYGMKNALFHVLAIPTEDPDATRPVVEVGDSGPVETEKKRGPGRPKKTIADVAADQTPPAPVQESSAPVTQAPATAGDLEALTAKVRATESVEALNALIASELRSLPNDQQLAIAKVCREQRQAKGWK